MAGDVPRDRSDRTGSPWRCRRVAGRRGVSGLAGALGWPGTASGRTVATRLLTALGRSCVGAGGGVAARAPPRPTASTSAVTARRVSSRSDRSTAHRAGRTDAADDTRPTYRPTRRVAARRRPGGRDRHHHAHCGRRRSGAGNGSAPDRIGSDRGHRASSRWHRRWAWASPAADRGQSPVPSTGGAAFSPSLPHHLVLGQPGQPLVGVVVLRSTLPAEHARAAAAGPRVGRCRRSWPGVRRCHRAGRRCCARPRWRRGSPPGRHHRRSDEPRWWAALPEPGERAGAQHPAGRCPALCSVEQAGTGARRQRARRPARTARPARRHHRRAARRRSAGRLRRGRCRRQRCRCRRRSGR